MLDARHLEQVLGELLEPVHVPRGANDQLVLSRVHRTGPLRHEQLDRAADDGQRAAEVMRHLREELALHLLELAKRLGLRALVPEGLALRAQCGKLAQQAGDEESLEQVHRDRERQALRFRRQAEGLVAIEARLPGT